MAMNVRGYGNRFPHARRASTRQERGAAVFLVVMVMALLTAMGIFALRSASLADTAAGFDREGAQAALIAQYGVTASAAYLGRGIADNIVNTMRAPPANTPPCESNGYPMSAPKLIPPTPCYRVDQTAVQASLTASTNELIFAPTNNASGTTSSLNVNEKTDAAFNVELTELTDTGVPLPGDGGGRALYEVTLTSLAQVRPVGACPGDGPATATATQAVVRSLVTFGGPVWNQ